MQLITCLLDIFVSFPLIEEDSRFKHTFGPLDDILEYPIDLKQSKIKTISGIYFYNFGTKLELDLERLEVIQYCQHSESTNCKQDFKHTFAAGGICNSINSALYSSVFKTQYYGNKLFKQLYNVEISEKGLVMLPWKKKGWMQLLLDTHASEVEGLINPIISVTLTNSMDFVQAGGPSAFLVQPGVR